MNAAFLDDDLVPELDRLIARHGLRRLLRALALRPFQPGRRRPPPLVLNDHLRRDIGLGPEPFHRDPWLIR